MDNFLREVVDTSERAILNRVQNEGLGNELARTLYLERIRLTEKPWRADPKDEKQFWNNIKQELLNNGILSNGGTGNEQKEKELLEKIMWRYAHEIAGYFDPSTYRFAKRAVPFIFGRLLNAALAQGFKGKWSDTYAIRDKIRLTGNIEHIRELAKDHTIVLVPTHSSNLDSILMGWVIKEMGLPAFLYGAGLNLFGIRILAYFMNRLGAYKVDRRKKNPIYFEILKNYSSLAIHRGCHSLFFPGGTRSRSGQIENTLKLGLLGSALDGQLYNLQQAEGRDFRKIIVVPAVINYHFTLEAPSLIDSYLKQTGQERYIIENDEYSTSYKISKFLFKFFTADTDLSVSFGSCMDLLGNEVDEEGVSHSRSGREIDFRDYFVTRNEYKADKQRDREYIHMLGERIVEQYYQVHEVFSSYVVAFTGFELLQRKFKRLDLYQLLRLPKEDRHISYTEFAETVERLLQQLRDMRDRNEIRLAPHMETDVEEIIEHGLNNVGLYNANCPLIKDHNGDLTSEDMNLLYYYHNRLMGYGLEKTL